MVFHDYIMVVTWFSYGRPSYNTMVDIDTNMVNHVSTLFTTAGMALKNFSFRENWAGSWYENSLFAIFDPTWAHILAPKRSKYGIPSTEF